MSELIYARDVYGKTLVELGKKDKRIVVLDADLSQSTRTQYFAKEFPERFFNVGVAEQNLMGIAAGLASCGKIVFASTFAMFATCRAFDQIRNTICYNGFNVKIVASHGGITVGPDGASHQAIEDIALMRSIPGMNIIVPCDGPETEKAIIAAYQNIGPFYIRLGRPKVPTVEGKKEFVFGKGYILKEGKDVTLISTGFMVYQALKASEILKNKGISAKVVNIHTIKPIDKDLILECAQTTKGIVTCEEHSVIGGLGSAVCEVLSEAKVFVPLKRIGVQDRFGQSGSPEELLKEYKLTPSDIAEAAISLLKR